MIRHSFEHGMYLRSRQARRPRGTVLYVHGLGESCLSMEPLIGHPRLDGWSHLAPDLPGYGKSPWPEEPMSLEDQAGYLAGWLERRGEGPVVVAGHSMGGVVGLILCESFPRRAVSFLNVEGNVSPDDCTISARAARYTRERFALEGFREMLDLFHRAARDDPVMRDYHTGVRICDPRAYHRNSGELVELSARGNLAPRMAALEIPVLYLLGDPRGTGEDSRSLLSEAGVPWRAVEDAGHWPFADQPDRFLDEMVGFLERSGGGNATSSR